MAFEPRQAKAGQELELDFSRETDRTYPHVRGLHFGWECSRNRRQGGAGLLRSGPDEYCCLERFLSGC